MGAGGREGRTLTVLEDLAKDFCLFLPRRLSGVDRRESLCMFPSAYMNTTATTPILERLSALGDETRTRILALLERSEMTVSELCSVLQIAQPNVSRHLKTLTSEGWIEARAAGRSRHYRLAAELEPAALGLWQIVRDEVTGTAPFNTDADRAGAVLDERGRQSAAFFAEVAERWDEVRADLFGSSAAAAPLLGLLRAEWTVGDLGTGTGALAETIAPFVQKVIGVDRSGEMLEAAKVRTESLDSVDLRLGELEGLPIEDAELDVAILALVLHYVVDPVAVLHEVARALKPGGSVIILDMREHQRGVGYLEDMGHVWPGFATADLRSWLERSGFSGINVTSLRPDLSASGPPLFLASARNS